MPIEAKLKIKILRATNNKDIPTLKELLMEHASNIERLTDATPLHFAAGEGLKQTVLVLLEDKSVNVNAVDSIKLTPLTVASLSKQTDIVEILLNHSDILPNIQAKDGSCALVSATIKGDARQVKILVNHPRIDVNIVGDNEAGPSLITAFHYGYTEIIDLLLNHKDIDVNKGSIYNFTPLMAAITSEKLNADQKLDYVKRLVAKGARINERTTEELVASVSAIQYAKCDNLPKIVEYLESVNAGKVQANNQKYAELRSRNSSNVIGVPGQHVPTNPTLVK